MVSRNNSSHRKKNLFPPKIKGRRSAGLTPDPDQWFSVGENAQPLINH